MLPLYDDSIQYYLSSAYLILPQPEPIFDLRHFTPEDLQAVQMRKNFRSYLFIGNLGNKTSETANWIKQDLGSEKVRRAQEDKNFNISISRCVKFPFGSCLASTLSIKLEHIQFLSE